MTHCQRIGILLAALLTSACAGGPANESLPSGVASSPAQHHHTTLSGIRVSGNHLVDGNSDVIDLHGINRSGTEYACIQGWGIFDDPSDAPSVEAMTTWNVNIVRVLLNEDCWLDSTASTRSTPGATISTRS
ncbi:MAG TPA: hypothetical protein VFE16_03955 [Candidatus Cybelea sp.]|jgi:hypothetical protein|nr:hypothetical protein [Candidatus Cybelea sp.]